MSSREKRLLFFFLAAIVVIGGLFAFRWVKTKKQDLEGRIGRAEATLQTAEFARDQWESVQSERAWLDKYEPKPKVGEIVRSQLETTVTNEARRAGLTINRPDILENDVSGQFYHRARFKVQVTGMENGLYQWLCRVHSPRDFRAVTELRLSPNREDDTKIDATVLVQEWFVPQSDTEPEVEAPPESAEANGSPAPPSAPVETPEENE